MKTVLVVGAHPDDEVLGCGATMARMIKEKHRVVTLILGEGVTSRDEKRDAVRRGKQIASLQEQARKANRLLGVKEVVFGGLPDNRFDTVPLLDIIKIVEKTVNAVKPSVVYTHFSGDLNIDHRITCQAVVTACRPLPKATVAELYSFEVPSSTDWAPDSAFVPDLFVQVTNTLQAKIRALSAYTSEVRRFPHPRSGTFLKTNAAYWGGKSGLGKAEAFKTIRCLRR